MAETVSPDERPVSRRCTQGTRNSRVHWALRRPLLAPREHGKRLDGDGLERVLDADRIEDGAGHVGVAVVVQVHPVGVDDASAGLAMLAHPRRMSTRCVAVRGGAAISRTRSLKIAIPRPRTERGVPGSRRPPGSNAVNTSNRAPVAASLPSAASYALHQRVDVDLGPHDVVAAGVDREQVRLQGDGGIDLLGDDAVELAAADREVGVPEVRRLVGQHGRDAVGPTAQPVGGGGVRVADALGERVAEGDVTVERHGGA